MRLNIIHISLLIQFDVPELKYLMVYSVHHLRRQQRYEKLHCIKSPIFLFWEFIRWHRTYYGILICILCRDL
jgi:hypothetical protein